MRRVNSSELRNSDVRLTRGDDGTVEKDLKLQSLTVGRGSEFKVQGNLTVEGEVDVYRQGSKVEVTGDMLINGTLNIRRNSTINIGGSLTFNGGKIRVSRRSELGIGNDLKSRESEVDISRGSTLNVEYGDLRCNTAKIGHRSSEVRVENGRLIAESIYVQTEDSLVVNEIMADTNPYGSVNDSGKYVEDKDENDTDLFDVSRDSKDSVDVHEYEPKMDTSNLVVWIEAKIMSEAENQEFPFGEFDRIVNHYSGLRNILGSITTAEDAKKISEMNSNINLTQYQIDKIENTQQIAERRDSKGIEQLRRVGEEIDEYNPTTVERLNQPEDSEEENDDSDGENDDNVSAFDW